MGNESTTSSEPPKAGRLPFESEAARIEMMVKTVREGSQEWTALQRKLAELTVEEDPWRASLAAKKAIAYSETDDRAWAVLALAQALLGQHRFAAHAYREALRHAPENPWYAHNLGHLLDVAMDAPGEALPLLARAANELPTVRSVRASYAHALGRTGNLAAARKLLAGKKTIEERALLAWLESGAEDAFRGRLPLPSPPRPSTRHATVRSVARILRRGLASLPLTAPQRRTALLFLREPVAQALAEEGELSLAAAIGYAVVFVEKIPLSQREVAASFRVSSTHLRNRFRVLQRELDLQPGDARFSAIQ